MSTDFGRILKLSWKSAPASGSHVRPPGLSPPCLSPDAPSVSSVSNMASAAGSSCRRQRYAEPFQFFHLGLIFVCKHIPV